MSYQNPPPNLNLLETGKLESGNSERVSPFQEFELGFPVGAPEEPAETNPISSQIGSAPLVQQQQTMAPPLAGILRRAAAKLTDLLLTNILYLVLLIVWASRMDWVGRTTVLGMAVLLGLPAVWLTWFLYNVLLNGRTVGKRIFRLEVVTETWEPLGPGRNFGRALAETLSGALVGIGFLFALFDPGKRTLHDHLCGTRVIRKEAR